ncbi:MAG TPA: hypothetical protein VFY87_25845 [Geminicoccaceae bacterium]|nr:hypothetical protein [Geminicoccaceae bacterium]
MAYDDVDAGIYNKDLLSPKLGIQWNATRRIRLRGAYFSTLQKDLLTSQTIEPTQVAGFNQLYDDFNGTKARRVGIALDAQPTERTYAGADYLRSWLDVPESEGGSARATTEEVREQRVRGYLYWIPADRWAFGIEVIADQYELARTPTGDDVPGSVNTRLVPLSIRYFDPAGWFAQATATYVDQHVGRGPDAMLDSGSDNTVVVDAVLGYRLRGGLGTATLEGRNLLDSKFNYQDENYRTNQDQRSTLIPERRILARLTLHF